MSEESYARNLETVDNIYDTVCQIVHGELFRDEDGNEVTRPEDADDNWEDNHERISLYDYFSDNLGIEYSVRGTRENPEILGVKIMIACGGPNIYVCDDRVKLYWWSEHAESRHFPDDVEKAIFEFADEMFGL